MCTTCAGKLGGCAAGEGGPTGIFWTPTNGKRGKPVAHRKLRQAVGQLPLAGQCRGPRREQLTTRRGAGGRDCPGGGVLTPSSRPPSCSASRTAPARVLTGTPMATDAMGNGRPWAPSPWPGRRRRPTRARQGLGQPGAGPPAAGAARTWPTPAAPRSTPARRVVQPLLTRDPTTGRGTRHDVAACHVRGLPAEPHDLHSTGPNRRLLVRPGRPPSRRGARPPPGDAASGTPQLGHGPLAQ